MFQSCARLRRIWGGSRRPGRRTDSVRRQDGGSARLMLICVVVWLPAQPGPAGSADLTLKAHKATATRLFNETHPNDAIVDLADSDAGPAVVAGGVSWQPDDGPAPQHGPGRRAHHALVVLGDVAVPVGIADHAVDQLARGVGVPGVAACPGHHVNEHAVEGDGPGLPATTVSPGQSRCSPSIVASAAAARPTMAGDDVPSSDGPLER